MVITMGPLSGLVQNLIDGFVEDLLNEARDLSPTLSSTISKIEIFDTIEAKIRRHREDHLPFNWLPPETVHQILGMALNLDRIHDHDLPLYELEQHRKNLFNFRRTSSTWNALLLSDSRYWCVIDIAAPGQVVKTMLARAQQAPLCLYSNKICRSPGLDNGYPALLYKTTQVQTIRLRNDPENIGRRLLGHGIRSLRTLEIPKVKELAYINPTSNSEYPAFDLTGLRHLIAGDWLPDPKVVWLQNLQTITLNPPLVFELNTLQVLGKCYNLSGLTIRLSGAKSIPGDRFVELPRLEDIYIEVEESAFLNHVVPKLLFSGWARRFLRINQAYYSDASIPLIRQFLYADSDGSTPPQHATLEIRHTSYSSLRAVYTAGKGGFDVLPARVTQEGGDAFHALTHAVQTDLKNPPLSLTLLDPDRWEILILRRLGDLNVTRIWLRCRESSVVSEALGVLANNHPPSTLAAEVVKWPFESLKELVIQGAAFNVCCLTRMIGIRHRYLSKSSKTWVRKVTLVGCSLYGMDFERAVAQMAAIGVTLVESESV